MKAAILIASRKFEIREVPIPEIGKNEMLIKVRACGICGSDLFVYEIGPFRENQILGHEFTGDVTAVGSEVKKFKNGDRVVINPPIPCRECRYCKEHKYNMCIVYNLTGLTTDGAYAEYVKVPDYQAYSLPDDIGYAEGTALQPMSSSQHAVRQADLKFGDIVAVYGAGPSGLLAMQWARAFGAAKVIAIEVAERRIAVAKQYADHVIDASKQDVVAEINKLTDDGVDAVIECSGNIKAQGQSLDVVRKGGCIVMYGISHDQSPVPLNIQKITTREIIIKGSINNHEHAYDCSIEAAKSNKIDLSLMPIRRGSLDEIDEMFESLIKAEEVRGAFVFG